MVTRMMILGIFAMSLDLLQGVTGLVSLGHAAYFGLAGYALAFLTPAGEAVSLWWTLPLAVLEKHLQAQNAQGLAYLAAKRFTLRFQHAVGQVENTAEVRKTRRELARVKTALATKLA